MKRFFSITIFLLILLSFTFGSLPTAFAVANDNYVYLGGIPAGFELNIKGVKVIGLCDVVSKEGVFSPSKDSGIEIGDILLKIGNNTINSAEDINNYLKEGVNDVTICRNNCLININVTPVKDVSGMLKIGLFVRNDVSGIGTITFITPDGIIAALGHPVMGDNSEILKINNGTIYSGVITGYNKGERGAPGELKGVFERDNIIGKITANRINGVYGKSNKEYNLSNLKKVEIADNSEVKIGDAEVYTTIDGKTPKYYKMNIVKIDLDNQDNRNFIVKITDQELLEETGGIIQGMSGSPILQNGKLIGAVTHVYINDPSRGFGIFIDNMKIQ